MTRGECNRLHQEGPKLGMASLLEVGNGAGKSNENEIFIENGSAPEYV